MGEHMIYTKITQLVDLRRQSNIYLNLGNLEIMQSTV